MFQDWLRLQISYIHFKFIWTIIELQKLLLKMPMENVLCVEFVQTDGSMVHSQLWKFGRHIHI